LGASVVPSGGVRRLGRGDRRDATRRFVRMVSDSRPTLPAMKKVIVILVVLALAAFAVKKLQDA
jgi:hypothetical protein